MPITKQELDSLRLDIESDRVERTEAREDTDKFAKAVCAFSNDMPAHNQPGYLLIGVKKDGSLSGLQVNEQLLESLAGLRADGNIQPLPRMNVNHFDYPDGQIAVVEVFPADMPPVRYKGRSWIRVGPRQAIASEVEERILTEKRISQIKNFDARPCIGSALDDLLINVFRNTYLPLAVSQEVIEENHRDIKIQLASLRFFDLKKDCPTYAGILLFGKDPIDWLPGAYIQFLQIDGKELTDPIINEKTITGDLLTILQELDLLVKTLIREYPIHETVLREKMFMDYPEKAIRELLMNAVMHRNYESSAPIKLYWFNDKIEIQSPGGLYGEAKESFPKFTAYRNPVIAEAMKALGYVNRFGRGIQIAQEALKKNESKPAVFDIEYNNAFSVTVWNKK